MATVLSLSLVRTLLEAEGSICVVWSFVRVGRCVRCEPVVESGYYYTTADHVEVRCRLEYTKVAFAPAVTNCITKVAFSPTEVS